MGIGSTMYQLRNVIHLTKCSDISRSDRNMNAAEDFMVLMLHTHVVAAAKMIHLLKVYSMWPD